MQRCDASHICSSSPQLSSAQTQGPFANMSPPCFAPPILAIARRGPDIHFRQRVLTALTSAPHNQSPRFPLFPPPRSSARLKRRSVSELSQVVKGNRGDRRHGCGAPASRPRQISVTAYCKLQYKKQGWI